MSLFFCSCFCFLFVFFFFFLGGGGGGGWGVGVRAFRVLRLPGLLGCLRAFFFFSFSGFGASELLGLLGFSVFGPLRLQGF